jgi:hypothetical protein
MEPVENSPLDRLAAARRSSTDRPATARPKDPQRSRVTNGSELVHGVDGRSVWVRRAKDIIHEVLSDLGGLDNTSAAERSIVRRAATLTIALERLEAKFATAGEASAADLDAYQRGANSLRRLLEAIGLQRRQRGLTLDDGAVEVFSPMKARWAETEANK